MNKDKENRIVRTAWSKNETPTTIKSTTTTMISSSSSKLVGMSFINTSNKVDPSSSSLTKTPRKNVSLNTPKFKFHLPNSQEKYISSSKSEAAYFKRTSSMTSLSNRTISRLNNPTATAAAAQAGFSNMSPFNMIHDNIDNNKKFMKTSTPTHLIGLDVNTDTAISISNSQRFLVKPSNFSSQQISSSFAFKANHTHANPSVHHHHPQQQYSSFNKLIPSHSSVMKLSPMRMKLKRGGLAERYKRLRAYHESELAFSKHILRQNNQHHHLYKNQELQNDSTGISNGIKQTFNHHHDSVYSKSPLTRKEEIECHVKDIVHLNSHSALLKVSCDSDSINFQTLHQTNLITSQSIPSLSQDTFSRLHVDHVKLNSLSEKICELDSQKQDCNSNQYITAPSEDKPPSNFFLLLIPWEKNQDISSTLFVSLKALGTLNLKGFEELILFTEHLRMSTTL